MFGDSRKHSRPYLDILVKREHNIRPANSFENTMGTTRLALEAPPKPQQSRQYPLGFGCRPFAHGTTAKTLLI